MLSGLMWSGVGALLCHFAYECLRFSRSDRWPSLFWQALYWQPLFITTDFPTGE